MIFDGGLPETHCGVGSTLSATVNVREWLPGALRELGVSVLLDAPCGDRAWIRHAALPCAYIGVDHEPELVQAAQADGADVRLLDIRTDPLPLCDAVLCRDFLQHLSMADAELALDNIEASGAAYLFATCHGQAGRDIETGEKSFRYVDMRASFGPPLASVSDGKHGRILGVWEL